MYKQWEGIPLGMPSFFMEKRRSMSEYVWNFNKKVAKPHLPVV